MSKRVANTPTSQKHGDGHPPPSNTFNYTLQREILLHNREIDKKKQAKKDASKLGVWRSRRQSNGEKTVYPAGN